MSAIAALEVYGSALTSAEPDATLHYRDGSRRALGIGKWVRAADRVDRRLVARCTGPTVDVGCGPGRLLAALAEAAVPALGIDVSDVAVRLAGRHGAPVLRRSVFDRLPGEGLWHAALLVDGNIGIGGDPVRLLGRCADLVRPGGLILTEVEAPGARSGAVRVALEHRHRRSDWFPWAHVTAAEIGAVAARAGCTVAGCWDEEGRWFADVRAP